MQLEINLDKNKNPRWVYLRVVKSLNLPIEEDYFSYDKFDVGEDKVNLPMQVLYKAITRNDGKDEYKEAIKLFKDYDNRVFIDSCLLFHGITKTAELTRIDPLILDAYVTFFLDTKLYTSLPKKDYFINSIIPDDVFQWFSRAKTYSFDDLQNSLNNIKATKTQGQKLQELFDKFYHDALTLGNLGELALAPEKITGATLNAYKIASRAAIVATNIAKTQFQYDSIINKNQDSFMKRWKIILGLDDASQFEKQKSFTENEKEILAKQINEISPFKEMPS